MISVDTNILLHAQNADCPEHEAAREFLVNIAPSQDVAICELVLVELYLLLRNPAVVRTPLGPAEAAEMCREYRGNPLWRLIENAPGWKESGPPPERRGSHADASSIFGWPGPSSTTA